MFRKKKISLRNISLQPRQNDQISLSAFSIIIGIQYVFHIMLSFICFFITEFIFPFVILTYADWPNQSKRNPHPPLFLDFGFKILIIITKKHEI